MNNSSYSLRPINLFFDFTLQEKCERLLFGRSQKNIIQVQVMPGTEIQA
jgi:hypothetical protein